MQAEAVWSDVSVEVGTVAPGEHATVIVSAYDEV